MASRWAAARRSFSPAWPLRDCAHPCAPHPALQVAREIYGPRSLADGFRNPALVRFTSGEETYLSPSHGGPRMWCA